MANKLRFTPDYLVCPRCMELLTRDDVEGFNTCPYCEHRFEAREELEEFLLQPIVRTWMHQSNSEASDIVSG